MVTQADYEKAKAQLSGVSHTPTGSQQQSHPSNYNFAGSQAGNTITQADIDRVLNLALGKDTRPLTMEERARYNISREIPNVLDVTALQQRMSNIAGKTLEQHSPVQHANIAGTQMPDYKFGDASQFGQQDFQQWQPTPWEPPAYSPTHDETAMSMGEMMSVINNRMDLLYEPQISGLHRGLEEQTLAAERRKGEAEAAYETGKRDIQKSGEAHQRKMSEVTGRRGIYDSGLATHVADRIQGEYGRMGYELSKEQSRVLSDIAEYVHLQHRHTQEQIQELMGQRGQMAQSMLHDMQMQQQSRQDALRQQNFLNHLEQTRLSAENHYREQQMSLQGQQHMLDQQKHHDTMGLSVLQHQDNMWLAAEQMRQSAQNQAWQQGFAMKSYDADEAHRAWERIFAQNEYDDRKQAEHLLLQNQISQQEFENGITLDTLDLKIKLYEWESRRPY